MTLPFAEGKKALGICDTCGLTYRLNKLKDVYVRGTNTHIKACPTCWDPDQPQLRIGEVDTADPQALNDPRPDTGKDASTALKVRAEDLALAQALGVLNQLGSYTT